MLLPQVLEVGLAVAASDHVQMETDIIGVVVIEDAEQEAPELFARRATDPVAPPDRTQVMEPVIASLDPFDQTRTQIGISAKLGFDPGHQGRSQSFVEIGVEFRIGPDMLCHAGYCTKPPVALATSGSVLGRAPPNQPLRPTAERCKTSLPRKRASPAARG